LLTPVSRVPEVSGASLVLVTSIIAVLLLRTPVEESAHPSGNRAIRRHTG
jgi:hypothetical protein